MEREYERPRSLEGEREYEGDRERREWGDPVHVEHIERDRSDGVRDRDREAARAAKAGTVGRGRFLRFSRMSSVNTPIPILVK